MYNDDNKFNLYLAQITDAFNVNPIDTTDIIKKYCDCVDYKEEKNKKLIVIDKYAYILLLVLVCVGILLLGLSNLEEFFLYFFGWIFFVVGMLVGSFVPVFGIIFLLSHGMTGFGLMLHALELNNYFVILSDSPKLYSLIFGVLVVGLFSFGVFSAIIHSLGKLKDKKYGVCYSFICFFFLILILVLIPEIIKFLNWVL